MSKENESAVEDVEFEDSVATMKAESVPAFNGDESASDIDLTSEDDDEDSDDSLVFSNGVIEKIVALAMRDVPGVVGMKGGWLSSVRDVLGASDIRKGVSIEVTPDSAVMVQVSVIIEYGAYAPQVFEDVKQAIVSNVTGMTGLRVAGVNLRIEDVLTKEEIERMRGSKEAAPKSDAEEVVEAEKIEELGESPEEPEAD